MSCITLPLWRKNGVNQNEVTEKTAFATRLNTTAPGLRFAAQGHLFLNYLTDRHIVSNAPYPFYVGLKNGGNPHSAVRQ